MIETLSLAGLAALGTVATEVARRFSVTSHGDNPWTFDAFLNTLKHAHHMLNAVGLLQGTINDSYRSPAVNAAVGGVSNSYHQKGLAVDIKPGPGFTPESGARLMYTAACRGDIGPARTVIWEPGWVHVDWHDPTETGPPPPCRFFKKLVSGKYETVKP